VVSNQFTWFHIQVLCFAVQLSTLAFCEPHAVNKSFVICHKVYIYINVTPKAFFCCTFVLQIEYTLSHYTKTIKKVPIFEYI